MNATAPDPMVPDRVDTIIVPLDGSEFSERALPVAARLAQRLDAEILLFSAVPTEDEVERRKAELVAYRPPCRQVSRKVVVSLDPAGAIHETLRSLPRAVVCMSSHGRGRSVGLVGSVASEVVARGHDPLVVVGPLVDNRPGGHGILTCVDDSPMAAEIIPVALRWSGLLHEPAIVATVAEPLPPPVRQGAPTRRIFGPDGDVDAFLESLVEPFRRQGDKLETAAIYDPVSPALGVHAYLRDHPASLVIVASHARSGLARLVLGSVAANIVHESTSPVLVVPARERR